MNASKILKVLGVAALAGAAHTVAENIPDLLPLIPPKYQGLAVVAAGAAALYLKTPPKGGGSTPSSGLPLAGAAIVLLILGVLGGAVSHVHTRAALADSGVAAASTLPVNADELVAHWPRLAMLPPATAAVEADRLLLVDLVTSPVLASDDRGSTIAESVAVPDRPEPFFDFLEATAQ